MAKLIAHPVPWLLVFSYAYYIKDDNLISDEEYDYLYRYVVTNHSSYAHPALRFIDKDAGSTSMFNIKAADYPSRTVRQYDNIKKYEKVCNELVCMRHSLYKVPKLEDMLHTGDFYSIYYRENK